MTGWQLLAGSMVLSVASVQRLLVFSVQVAFTVPGQCTQPTGWGESVRASGLTCSCRISIRISDGQGYLNLSLSWRRQPTPRLNLSNRRLNEVPQGFFFTIWQ